MARSKEALLAEALRGASGASLGWVIDIPSKHDTGIYYVLYIMYYVLYKDACKYTEYEHTYIYIYIYTYTCKYTSLYIYIYIYIYTCMYIYIYIQSEKNTLGLCMFKWHTQRGAACNASALLDPRTASHWGPSALPPAVLFELEDTDMVKVLENCTGLPMLRTGRIAMVCFAALEIEHAPRTP